jgi:Putative restriction endonuclease
MRTKTRATIEDLYKVEGKAELVNGEIVHMPPSGDEPSSAGFEIATNLKAYARRIGRGRAYPDGPGFHVHLPHRESFSPDTAYHIGPRTGMRFLEGAPVFAVEVRSEHDYGPAAQERDTCGGCTCILSKGYQVLYPFKRHCRCSQAQHFLLFCPPHIPQPTVPEARPRSHPWRPSLSHPYV